MKKTALTLTLIFAFLFSIVAGLFLADVGKAESEVLYFKPQHCDIFILSPDWWLELSPESFRVIFTIRTSYELDVDSCCYILDGDDKEAGLKVEDFQLMNERVISDEMVPDTNATYFPYREYSFVGQIFLGNLSYGEHKLSVYVQGSEGNTLGYETIPFTIPEKPELPELSEIETVPKTSVIASIVTAHVGAIGLVLLLYFIKRKQLRIK